MQYAVDRFATGAGLEARTRAPSETRLAGLDGLRAVAVVAVFLFHADLGWAKGGYLGVDLFFVISGFLITGLLAGECERTGALDLVAFYWRRAKRLLPASWLMTAGAVVAAALFAPDALPRLRSDAVASLLYVTNWEMIFANTSYFEEMGRQPLLQHLWSLAIEEQFYILWAPVILFGLPRLGRRGIAVVAAVLAIASAVWMGVLVTQIGWPDQGNPTRLYFGTDTHGFPLLVGAILGLLWRPNHQTGTRNPAEREGGFIAGALAFGGMIALFALLGEETAWLYPWGFLLSAACSAGLIAAATWQGSAFGAFLDMPAMRWIGERSYGMYLWHWPVFMLTRPGLDLPFDGDTVFAIRAVLTVGISALSYRFVETPIREGAIERLWAARRVPAERRRALLRGAAMAAAGGGAFLAVAAILVFAPPRTEPAQDVREALGLTAKANTVAVQPVAPLVAPAMPALPGAPPVESFTGKDLTAVGDSVLLGSSAMLKATLAGAQVYATMGWQASDVLKQLQTLADAKRLTPVVLVHLGTNGYITENQLRNILSLLSDRKRVILVNTRVPRRWMEANNALIDRVIADYPNVVLVNWRDASDGEPDYFISDGVHLTDIGQRAFISEIMRAGHLVRTPSAAAGGHNVVDPDQSYGGMAGDLSRTLVRNPQPAAPDSYWKRMAQCETGGDWQNGGRYSGGLGIFVGSWAAWGGREFAPTPAAATPAQQIEIANRISTQGWKKPDGTFVAPVGFTGWRCISAVGHPATETGYVFTPESVLAQQFHLNERGDVVRDLELMLGLPRDGIYGKRVRLKHIALLKTKGLPAELAGAAR